MAIVVLGLGLRLYRLDAQSVWYDEAESVLASRAPLSELNANIVRASSHPPFHYYLLHASFQLLGFGTWQARAVSVLFGTLAMVALYALASYLFDVRTALMSTALLATSQLGIMYSQEARPYAVLLFLSIVTQLLFLLALRSKDVRAWWAAVVVATVMIYTHYYGAFVVAALVAYAVIVRKRYSVPFWWWLAAGAMMMVMFAPWVLTSLPQQMAIWMPVAVAAQPPWFDVTWRTPVGTLNMFNNGKFSGLLDSAPAWSFPAGALIYTLPALVGLVAAGRIDEKHRQAQWFLLAVFIVPFVAVIALGWANVVYDVRYVSYCIAPYYILVGYGVARIRSGSIRTAVMVVAAAYGLVALRANYSVPYKENYRDALSYLAQEYRAADVCVFLPFGLPLQWQVYHANHPGLRRASLDEVDQGVWRDGRVWLITYRRTPAADRLAREAEDRLRRSYTLLTERRYFWVTVAVYVRPHAQASQHPATWADPNLVHVAGGPSDRFGVRR